MTPLFLVTGFGSFEEVGENPSGALALRLAASPPPGVSVRALELPVTFRGAPAAYDEALAALAPEIPDVLLSLGVHKKGERFRLEARARARMRPGRLDNAGEAADALGLPDGPDLFTPFDLEAAAQAVRGAGGVAVERSDDAGGYVCERIYRHVLEVGARLSIPALFLHVPEIAAVSVDDQLPYVRALTCELARQLPLPKAAPTE